MIVRISKPGASFMGAGKYYLHDKLDEQRSAAVQSGARISMRDQTEDRVWFTDTRNCFSVDPERALEEMWRTAEDQAYLKQQAGIAPGGRRCENPVKTISLAWHKDDRPDPQHMVEQADSFLKHMGWDTHQAVYVGHNDTEHRHIHIILNRVNPETGRTLDDYRDQPRAQAWALAYEKGHENVRCEQREQRAAERERRPVELNAEIGGKTPHVQEPARAAANDHLPHNVIDMMRPNERAYAAEEETRKQHHELTRALLKAQQREEREAFFKDGAKLFKATRHAVYDEVRRTYAPEWRQFYKNGKADWEAAEAASGSALSRATHFLKRGQLGAARDAIDDRMSVRSAVALDLSTRKADLKARQTQDLREQQQRACDALRAARDLQYNELLQRQRDERAMMLANEALGQFEPAPPLALRANDNVAARAADAGTPAHDATDREQAVRLARSTPSVHTPLLAQTGGSVDLAHIVPPQPDAVAPPARGVSDLAAGGIGSAASYLADQLGELFAPTPPEMREAQAKEAAKRAAETPAVEKQPDKIVDSAMALIEAEKARQVEAYWKDRDRGKGWERDQ